jgi:negative regulator of genetic competence, sporulation and motility
MYLAIVVLLWFITAVLYFHKELSLFFTRKKENERVVTDTDITSDSIMGASHAVFLPIRDENMLNKDHYSDENIEFNTDDFEVEYEVEEEEEQGEVDTDEKPHSETVVSFEEMREAVSVAENKKINISEASDAVKSARRTFKLLEETELLAQMLKSKREIAERIEQLRVADE